MSFNPDIPPSSMAYWSAILNASAGIPTEQPAVLHQDLPFSSLPQIHFTEPHLRVIRDHIENNSSLNEMALDFENFEDLLDDPSALQSLLIAIIDSNLTNSDLIQASQQSANFFSQSTINANNEINDLIGENQRLLSDLCEARLLAYQAAEAAEKENQKLKEEIEKLKAQIATSENQSHSL